MNAQGFCILGGLMFFMLYSDAGKNCKLCELVSEFCITGTESPYTGARLDHLLFFQNG